MFIVVRLCPIKMQMAFSFTLKHLLGEKTRIKLNTNFKLSFNLFANLYFLPELYLSRGTWEHAWVYGTGLDTLQLSLGTCLD